MVVDRIRALSMSGIILVAVAGASVDSRTQDTEILWARTMGARAVVFETEALEGARMSSRGALGDFNQDGIADLPLDVATGEPGGDGRTAFWALPGSRSPSPRTLLHSSNVEAAFVYRSRQSYLSDSMIAGLGRDEGGAQHYLISWKFVRSSPGLGEGAVGLVTPPGSLGQFYVEDLGATLPGGLWYTGRPQCDVLRGIVDIGDFDGDDRKDVAIAVSLIDARPERLSSILLVMFDPWGFPDRMDLSTLCDAAFGADRDDLMVVIGEPWTVSAGLSAPGDVNGDGLDDILFTSGVIESDLDDTYVLYGRRSPPPRIDLAEIDFDSPEPGPEGPGVTRILPPTTRLRGLFFSGENRVAGVGDLDGDGYADFLVAEMYQAVAFPDGPRGKGRVRLFYGAPDLPRRIDWEVDAPRYSVSFERSRAGSVSDELGSRVNRAGDVNGDGLEDFLLAAPQASPRGLTQAGEVFLVHGRREYPPVVDLDGDFGGWRLAGPEVRSRIGGNGVAGIGDFNADGGQDVVVVTRQSSAPSDPEYPQRAFVIFGRGSGPAPFAVSEVAPLSGSVRGGTEVAIRGSGLGPETEVRFGNRAAVVLRWPSNAELIVSTPPGATVGPVAIEVSSGGEVRRFGERYEYTQVHPPLALDSLGRFGGRIDGRSGHEIGRSLDFGDVDGDGVDDLLIGSEREDGDLEVGILIGGGPMPSRLDGTIASERFRRIVAPDRVEYSGVRVSHVGDVNGDGIGDLVFAGTNSMGYLVFGRNSWREETLVDGDVAMGVAVELRPSTSYFTLVASRTGDVNGDGIDDLALGLSDHPTEGGAGSVVVLLGRTEWPPSVDPESPEAGRWTRIEGPTRGFGGEISWVAERGTAGALLVGTTRTTGGGRDSYLLPLGDAPPEDVSVDDWQAIYGGTHLERVPPGRLETSLTHVAVAGDLDGDGHDELIIGDEHGGDANRGLTFLIRGRSRADWPANLRLEDAAIEGEDGLLRIWGSSQMVQSGRGVGPAGDFDGDGVLDILVGEQGVDPFAPGTMYVVYGRNLLDGVLDVRLDRPGTRATAIRGVHPVTRLEVSSRRTGDLDGDGRQDFAFSEWSTQFFPAPEPGGRPSPGAVYVIYGPGAEQPFRRGDTNGDDRLDVSDAIFALQYLFSGGPGPICEDAVDVNDSGTLELTDAVRVLLFLFQGGAEPLPPFEEAGEDPTADELGCLGY